jgi:hypothetical protein
VGRVDQATVTDVQADVREAGEEHEVARPEVAARNRPAHGELLGCGARKPYAEPPVDVDDEA